MTPVNLRSLTDQQQLDEKKPKLDSGMYPMTSTPLHIGNSHISLFKQIHTNNENGNSCPN